MDWDAGLGVVARSALRERESPEPRQYGPIERLHTLLQESIDGIDSFWPYLFYEDVTCGILVDVCLGRIVSRNKF